MVYNLKEEPLEIKGLINSGQHQMTIITGTIQQLHMAIKYNFLHCFCESRSRSNTACAGALQTVNNTRKGEQRR